MSDQPPDYVETAELVEWHEVADLAQSCFDIWVDAPELAWAEYAWQLLIDAGLTAYKTEVERSRAVLRLPELAATYREFCAIGLDEGSRGDWRYEQPVVVGYPLLRRK